MSGVITEHGQFERCNECGQFVLIQTLAYELPGKKYKHGRDLCQTCAEKLAGQPTPKGLRIGTITAGD